MEKYSKFSDEATGISPFRQAKPLKSQTTVINTIAIWVLTVLTVPQSYLMLVLYEYLLKFILPAFLSRLLLNYGVFLFLRLFYSTFSYEGERRASVRKNSVIRAKAGDVLLSNFVSPLDPLIYESHRACVFAVPSADGMFAKLSTAQAVSQALSLQKQEKGTKLSELSAAAAKAGAILVLFVEGTTSNGRGVLSLKGIDARSIASVESQVFASAIKYSPPTAAAPVPSSLIGFLWRISTSAYWYMASIKVSGEPIKKGTISQAEIAKHIAALGRLRIMGDRMNIETKAEYVKARKS